MPFSKAFKAYKVSPPPKPDVTLQSYKRHALVRQVSDEDLESSQSSHEYLKSRNHILHNNERRPCASRVVSQPKHIPSRNARSLLAFVTVASIINFLRVRCYQYFKREHALMLQSSRPFPQRETPMSNARMLFLDHNYNVYVSTPYPNNWMKMKHRKILDPYPAEETDVTQLYSVANSNDLRLETMEMKIFPEHETNEDCIPMSKWQFMSFPTCNGFHEMEMTEHKILASGNWRDTWLRETYGDISIIKTLKYEHTFQERYYEFSRVDALAMERLTSNPFVMSVFGFCGVSVMTEQGKHAIGFVVGQLKSRDKLIVASQVALSIAAVHEIDGAGKPASLVHNDLNIDNMFWGERGPLLNDFNIAVLMMKDKNTDESCKFSGHHPNPQWKAPEEQSNSAGTSITLLDEKVDVYALGNILFRFATGKGPWREYASSPDASLTPEQKEEIAYLKSVKGATPRIPQETLESTDPYIKVILEAMNMCYKYKPNERPSARGVARFLQLSLENLDAEAK